MRLLDSLSRLLGAAPFGLALGPGLTEQLLYFLLNLESLLAMPQSTPLPWSQFHERP